MAFHFDVIKPVIGFYSIQRVCLKVVIDNFLADRTNGRAYATIYYVCMSSVTLCIVAKRCILEQKLLLTAYGKSYVSNRLVSKWMTWSLFRGRLRSREPLRHICHWISRQLLEIEAWFKITNRKWPMDNQMVTWSMASRDSERSNSWPQHAQSPISRKQLLEMLFSNNR